MAQIFSLAVAAVNETPLDAVVTVAVPAAQILVRPISKTYGSTACVSEVVVGPNLPSPMQIRYASATALATIVTNANA